jgi:hypothetical protein
MKFKGYPLGYLCIMSPGPSKRSFFITMDVWPPLPTEAYPPPPKMPCPWDDACPLCTDGIGFAVDTTICPSEEETQPTEEEDTEVELTPLPENKLLELWYSVPLLSEMRR